MPRAWIPKACRSCKAPLCPGNVRRPRRGVKRNAGRQLCRACYCAHDKAGTLEQFPKDVTSRAEIFDTWLELESLGLDRRSAAKRLGLTYDTFERTRYYELRRRAELNEAS